MPLSDCLIVCLFEGFQVVHPLGFWPLSNEVISVVMEYGC